MSTIQVSISQAESDLDNLIRQAISGDEVIIDDGVNGRVRLEPLPVVGGDRRVGGLPGFIIHMSDDFLEPMEDFKDYMP